MIGHLIHAGTIAVESPPNRQLPVDPHWPKTRRAPLLSAAKDLLLDNVIQGWGTTNSTQEPYGSLIFPTSEL